MLQVFKSKILKNLNNIQGWHTNRKIVVIESDDWGSIRMPSKEVYDILLKNGIRVDKCPYNSFDSLESESDIAALYEVLISFKDRNGNHPVITTNSIVANPDFEKIANSDFQEYHFEPFTETYKRYPNHAKSFLLLQEGIKNKLFYPQFHGREHLNVSRWMSALQNQMDETRLAFDHQLFGLSTNITAEKRKSFLAALDFEDEADQVCKQEIIDSGLAHFVSIFGFHSESFIAPNYTWGNDLLPILHNNHVKYIQGDRSQSHPDPKTGKNYSIRHTLGERTTYGQLYLTRNCYFEPTINPSTNAAESCLHDIQSAFLWRKPAIISSHRVNFMGGIELKNRETNLKSIYLLLSNIIKRWPDVEFMSSPQLGNLIQSSQ